MLLADTMSIFFVILGLMLAFPSLWLLCRGLWPNVTSGATAVCSRGSLRGFAVGVPITIGVALLAALSNLLGPLGKLAAAALICFYLVIANIGVAGFATAIGERLKSPADLERPWRATLRGGIILELTYLLPILGWFLILPASIIIGSGAATLSLIALYRTRSAASAPAATVENAA
ncbi:MAG TPA: hypothetical protein VFV34_10295 [Blastocatellia bacterium]|nr:hypothetical protein [Blastocatellia bacterium]